MRLEGYYKTYEFRDKGVFTTMRNSLIVSGLTLFGNPYNCLTVFAHLEQNNLKTGFTSITTVTDWEDQGLEKDVRSIISLTSFWEPGQSYFQQMKA